MTKIYSKNYNNHIKKYNKKLARVLNQMVAKDLRMQQKTRETGIQDLRIFKINTKKLKLIINKYGYPTINLAGRKESRNAWLLIQHSDHDSKFQKKCLKLIKTIYKKDPSKIDKENIAFLTDKILVNEKKKQLFGTQFYFNKKGKFTYRPIRDFKNLEKRRKKYGLPPLKVYADSAKSYNPKKIKKACIKS